MIILNKCENLDDVCGPQMQPPEGSTQKPGQVVFGENGTYGHPI